jgi:hypothetical protein
LSDEACRDTIVEQLLRNPQVVAQIIRSLVSAQKLTDEMLGAFVDEFLSDTTGKRNVIFKRMETNPGNRQLVADTLAGTQRGRAAMASALIKQLGTDAGEIEKLAEQLKQNPDFAALLREKLA